MPDIRLLILAIAALAITQASYQARADATIPAQDIPNARDNPLLRRYEGSFIVDYAQKAFDEFELPLSPLKEVAGKRDAFSNIFYAPEQTKTLEGKLTRIVYVAPAGRSPLEVIRNYEDEASGKGGEILYRCREQDCGGDNKYGLAATGWHQNVLMKVYPRGELRQPNFSNGGCALRENTAGVRYSALRLPAGDGDAHIAVVAYQLSNDGYCKALNGRTIVVVTVVEPKAREQHMVTVGASEMNAALNRDGRIVLRNILFDFDKADIKPDSRPQLEEIAKLMQANPMLRLHVVGHTDSQGQFAYNMDLSRRRAQSVVQALVKAYGVSAARLAGHGVGPLAPVAPNTDEPGRTLNRRTELTPQ